jgi:phage shock protein PspC (stress-responsive transcriptional regulator)
VNDTATPPPPPSPPAERRPLHRSREDRLIAGVAAGIADSLGVDPIVVRIGFVLVTVLGGGAGIVLYVIGVVLIPEGDDARASGPHPERGVAFWLGVALLVVVGLAVADRIGVDRGIVWPLIIVGAGLALWSARSDRPATDRPATGRPATVGWPAAPSTQETIAMTPTDTDPTAASTGPATQPLADRTATQRITPPPRRPDPPAVDWTPPPVPARDRSILGRLTIALALVASGVTVLLDRIGVVDATTVHVLAVALVTVGVGLVIGAWAGRARWLVLVGLALSPMVLAGGLLQEIDIDLTQGVGTRAYAPTTVADIPFGGYRLAAGEVVVDLRELDLRDATTVPVRVGAGQIEVIVPDDATIEVDTDVRVGQVDVFGEEADGIDIDRTFRTVGGGPTLTLDLSVGAGQITVTPVATSPR